MIHYKVIKDGTLKKILVVLPGFSKDDLKFFLRRKGENTYLVCECRKNEVLKEIYGRFMSELEIFELPLGFMDNPEVDSYKFENGILEVRIYDQPHKYDFNVTEEAMDDWDYRDESENFDCYLNDFKDPDYEDDDEYDDELDKEYPFIRP